MVRELRWGLFNRGTILIRVFYISFVFYFFTGALVIINPRSLDAMQNWILAQICLTVLVAPALMSNAFTKEYELGNMDMLRITLLRARDLVVGKLTAGAGSVTPLLASAVLSCVPVILAGARDYRVLGMGYATLFLCALLSLSVGLLCSMFTRRTSTSLVLSYVLSFIVFAGVFLGGRAILWWWTPELLETPGRGQWSYGLSPVTAFWSATRSVTRRDVDVLDFNAWALSMAAWFVVAAVFVWAAIRYFGRFKMRDP
jgi:ABC-type transport system involved in multi-copper enzyme maturation permease subunit